MKQACRLLSVTNQSPIGRGLLSLTDLNNINRRLEEELAVAGARLDDCITVHMILMLARRANAVNRSQAYCYKRQ